MSEATHLKRPAMRLVAVVVLGAWLGASGCYHHRAAIPNASHATEPREKVAWSWVWGYKQHEIQPDNCKGNGTTEVTVSTSWASALLTVVSLGFLSRAVITWRCAKDPPPPRPTAPQL